MVKGKLYGNKDSFRTQKVLIAAKLGNAQLQLSGDVPPAEKFPLGVTPAFEGDVNLFGAESIAIHVAGCATACAKNCAETVQWLQWAEGSLLPNILGYVLPSVSAAHLDKKVVDNYKAELLAQLTHLDDVLLSKTFLVGERLTLADVSVALDLLPAFQHVLDADLRKKFGNLTRWFQTVMHQPAVKEVLPEVHLCDKISQFNQAKFNELSAKHAKHPAHSHHGSKKEEKKKDHPKPAPKAKEPEVDDGADDGVVVEKSKDPFAEMPKGTFVMDNFKRVYSNEDTATKAIPYFWDNFDAEANSIWYCEYKFPTELTLTFMSCNLISGMYQRLEKLKKNAFASMILFGTDNNSTISGIWVWRGQELAFPLSPDWQVDYESYTWTKLDPKDEKTKKMVNEYLMWEGDFDGKKFNQGKIFK
ncbi:unnamed protein product [Nippostrongylus brasiliensis]|uniref:eEF-1B gamma n=1 Tax=Nippostrongylus brasiliensis TaxID=27835 RepID=A0A0N4Y5T5_NIPBR|nr:hypothetical protein Q1695_002226 [Nippostrongylus brasiliensis]VDL74977.1 unnamed protein product [Nippostrongylus brasiliensis]